LDEVIPLDIKIDFIKIDVEGAELGVLKGATRLLKKYLPIVIFEFGLGASDFYGTKPADMFNLLTKEVGLKISLLKSFIKNSDSLSLKEFEQYFNDNNEYYFIAHK